MRIGWRLISRTVATTSPEEERQASLSRGLAAPSLGKKPSPAGLVQASGFVPSFRFDFASKSFTVYWGMAGQRYAIKTNSAPLGS